MEQNTEIWVFCHHILSVGGISGRKPQEPVHNYLIELVAVHSDQNNIVMWNGKDAGKDCGTIAFPIGSLPVSQRLTPSKYSYPPLKFQASDEVSIFKCAKVQHNLFQF